MCVDENEGGLIFVAMRGNIKPVERYERKHSTRAGLCKVRRKAYKMEMVFCGITEN